MPTRKRISFVHHRNKGKYFGQKNNDTVFAPVDNIDPNEDDILDIAHSTASQYIMCISCPFLLPICPVFTSLSLSLADSSVGCFMFSGDLDSSEPQCCLFDNPCWDCGN